MAVYSVWILEKQNVTVSGGGSLDGITQGDGSHLVGRTITLNNRAWRETRIDDDDAFFDDNDGSQRLAGAQTIDGVTYASGTRVEAEYRLVLRDPGSGQTWTVIGYNVNNSSPAYGTIEGLAFVGPPAGWPPAGTPLTVVSASEGPGFSGQPRTTYDSYVTPPCFTPGTLIDTPQGPRPVEALVPGDAVTTLDDGPQILRHVMRTRLPPARLAAEPWLGPVVVPAGSLPGGLPRRDLVLSPTHCLLHAGAGAELLLGASEVLVPAGALRCARPAAPSPFGATYLHLVFDRHQILRAEGAATESLRLGPLVFRGAPAHVQQDLRRLFPGLGQPGGTPWHAAARPVLRPWEARLLAA